MIVYLISNFKGINTGKGGHYYSLFQMVKKIEENKSVFVFTIGEEVPLIFKSLNNSVHFSGSVLSIFRITKHIEKYINHNITEKIEIFHGYDEFSLYSVQELSKKFKSRYVMTKCGGVTKPTYPPVDKLIVFHSKDYNFYKSKKGFNEVYLIPNRVEKVKYNPERLEQLKEIYDSSFFNIIKIGRIGKYYKHTLQQGINLASVLSEKKNVRLLFIGYLESEHYKKELEDYARLKQVELVFFVEDKFTKNASELLWGADAVIGTGRGAMEAASLGKTIFFPVANKQLPCLLDRDTAIFALENNFSERTVVPDKYEYYFDVVWLSEILNDRKEIKNLGDGNLALFQEYFCIDKGVLKTLEVYRKIVQNEALNSHFLYLRYCYLGFKIFIKHTLRNR